MLGRDLITAIEHFAPPKLAMANDPIGLQIGSDTASIDGILTALEVTDQVIEEALEQQTNWLVVHHPLIYKPLRALNWENPVANLVAKMIKHKMNLYVAHTNLDITNGGVNDVLADLIHLTDRKPFIKTDEDRLQKLVVFVPTDHKQTLLEALATAGAGTIGNYSHCAFSVAGSGNFKPMPGSHAHIGNIGQLEQVEEIRLEMIFAHSKKKQILAAMSAAHPYEEVAYDIYDLNLPGYTYGLGRIGNLTQTTKLGDFITHLKEAWGIANMRSVGDQNAEISKVAVMGGSGARYLNEASQQQADLYITGDIDYHTAKDAEALGICLIDPGHHVEHLGLEYLTKHIEQQLNIQVVRSQIEMNPFRFI